VSTCGRLVERPLIGSVISGLVETEQAHKDALYELERMRDTMERMELERAEMVAEVEAQIERALASMAVDVDVDESDYSEELSSRPDSRMSTSARSTSGTRSRRTSDAMKNENNGSRLRSFGTESTLAESYERGMDDTLVASKSERETDTITEEEEAPVSPTKKKRFSATQNEVVQDGMMAVDEGISERSDKIAQKVLQIQQKVS
jgi:nicotinamide N-methyltransferase